MRHILARSGIRRIPAVAPLAHGTWRALFGWSVRGGGVIVRTRGVALEVPAASVSNYVDHDYEPITTEIFLNAVERGGVVVDVGAHIGYYACVGALAAGPNGSVHAIEPAAQNLEVLGRNANRNGLTNITIHHLAADATSGNRIFVLTEASDSHGFYNHPLAPLAHLTSVETRPVDELVSGRATVIKIDVEGAELEVLEGMRRLLTTSSGATLIVEWNPQCLASADHEPDELPAMMSELGVTRINVIDDHRRLIRPLRDVQDEIQAGDLPHGWYVNLYGIVR